MRKKAVFTLFVALVIGLKAQVLESSLYITFDQFKEIITATSIPGFTNKPHFEHEEDQFSAHLVGGGGVFLINLETRLEDGPQWMAAPYSLDGKNAEFATTGDLAMLFVDLPNINATLTLASNILTEKVDLEEVAKSTGLLQMELESKPWPNSIPTDYRIEGLLLDVSEDQDYDTEFSYQVRVTLLMSKQLVESLLQLANRYEDEGDFLRFPNGTILNYPFSGTESIEGMYEENDEITFTYYIP